jgi:SAM-dependent methyltransferase
MFTPAILRYLQSAHGTDLLESLKNADLSDANTLRLLTQLRKQIPADIAAAALEIAKLRIKARDKFLTNTDHLFLSREALEQASHVAISALRPALFEGFDHIADLGCGIGADTRWLAINRAVVGVDRDPVRLLMAKHNTAQLPVKFIQADLTDPLPFKGIRAAFFDPARRTEGRRIFSVRDYSPSLDVIRTWPFDALMVKLSPGVDLAELAPYPGSVQFVSVNGDLKEAQLLCGALDQGVPSALVIRVDEAAIFDPAHLTVIVLRSENLPAPPLRPPQGYLYEPDPAVIRAGVLSELAQALDIPMFRLDETIAYLTADTLVLSPLARAWLIEAWMPFNLKKLRAYLRERGVGRVTVKKRGSPILPEELIAKLKLPGDGEERVVVLTHVADQPAILICQPRSPA